MHIPIQIAIYLSYSVHINVYAARQMPRICATWDFDVLVYINKSFKFQVMGNSSLPDLHIHNSLCK